MKKIEILRKKYHFSKSVSIKWSIRQQFQKETVKNNVKIWVQVRNYLTTQPESFFEERIYKFPKKEGESIKCEGDYDQKS